MVLIGGLMEVERYNYVFNRDDGDIFIYDSYLDKKIDSLNECADILNKQRKIIKELMEKNVSLDNAKDDCNKVRRHIFDLCKGCEYLNNKNNCIMGMEHPTTDCVESIFKAKKKKEKK